MNLKREKPTGVGARSANACSAHLSDRLYLKEEVVFTDYPSGIPRPATRRRPLKRKHPCLFQRPLICKNPSHLPRCLELFVPAGEHFQFRSGNE